MHTALGMGLMWEDRAFAPLNTAQPEISGMPIVGQLLNVVAGQWSGNPQPVLSYQWQAGGVDIPGATGLSLNVLVGMVGVALAVKETASNSQGSLTVTSPPTALVSAL